MLKIIRPQKRCNWKNKSVEQIKPTILTVKLISPVFAYRHNLAKFNNMQRKQKSTVTFAYKTDKTNQCFRT